MSGTNFYFRKSIILERALSECRSEREAEEIYLKRFDELTKQLDDVDQQVNWLLKQEDGCRKDVARIRTQLEQIRS